MTRHERLQEQYEDALFALLMDGVAVSEGEKALDEHERLRDDPDAAVPELVERRCIKTISKHCSAQTRHATGRVAARVLNKVAVVAAAVALTFTVAFAASDTFRVNTLNLVIEVFGDRTKLQFGAVEVEKEEQGHLIKANWLPEGFALESQDSNSKSVWSVYTSLVGGEIKIQLYDGDGSTLSIDTENATVNDIMVQGCGAKITIKDDIVQIFWADEERNIFVLLKGSGVAQEKLIQVANQLELK